MFTTPPPPPPPAPSAVSTTASSTSSSGGGGKFLLRLLTAEAELEACRKQCEVLEGRCRELEVWREGVQRWIREHFELPATTTTTPTTTVVSPPGATNGVDGVMSGGRRSHTPQQQQRQQQLAASTDSSSSNSSSSNCILPYIPPPPSEMGDSPTGPHPQGSSTIQQVTDEYILPDQQEEEEDVSMTYYNEASGDDIPSVNDDDAHTNGHTTANEEAVAVAHTHHHRRQERDQQDCTTTTTTNTITCAEPTTTKPPPPPQTPHSTSAAPTTTTSEQEQQGGETESLLFMLADSSDDPTPCAVCGDKEPDLHNEMIFCSECNVCVHQLCYGLPHIPPGGWVCCPCAAGKAPHNLPCLFCPEKGGALKPVRKNDGSKDNNSVWAHVACALWIPNVTVTPTWITDTEKIDPARWKLKCSLCKLRQGACIQCQYSKNCYVAFHTTCARTHGLEMKEIVGVGGGRGRLEAYCKKHTYMDKGGSVGVVETDMKNKKKRKQQQSGFYRTDKEKRRRRR